GSILTDAALAIMKRISMADADGLRAADYKLPNPEILGPSQGTADAVADAEIILSLAVLTYTRNARIGRIQPDRVSALITLDPQAPDRLEVLTGLYRSRHPAALIANYNPSHEEFTRLRDLLAEMRGDTPGSAGLKPLRPGLALRSGVRGEQVTLLRRHLGHPDPAIDADLFDAELLIAVKTFQGANGLLPDGIVGPRTRKAINGPTPVNQEKAVLVNMEQWRWMPEDLGAFHVRVNIPEFRLRVVRRGQVMHQTRVIVGKPHQKTPVFSDEMEHVIVNPYWNVPLSIKRNEMLPSLLANPTGFTARHNYEVVYRGRPVPASSVNWYSVNLRAVNIRQRPGPRNALGRVKFMFPNQHSVYLHDTPTKSLFTQDIRAFSHGCIRVQNPMGFADAILDNEPNLDVNDLKALE
ncbi:unnamed protein product, partial [marine sediment metagenome]